MLKTIIYGIFLTFFIVGASIFYIFYSQKVPPHFWDIFSSLDKKYLILSLISLFLFHTFDNLRVFIISRAINLRYSFLYGYVVSLVSTFGATVTPAHLGGEFLPLYTLKRIGGKFHQIMSVITLKGIAGLFFYILFLPFTIEALIKDPKEAKDLLMIILAITLISLIVYIIWSVLKRKEGFISKELLRRIKYQFFKYLIVCKRFFKYKKKVFFLALILSIFMYIALLFIGVFLVKAFNSQASIKEVFLSQLPLVYAIFMSPTPGGSGVGELGAVVVFEGFISSVFIAPFAILWRILSQYLGALFGSILFLILGFKDFVLRKNKWL
ncbi:MAG: flippase-like domain-containing protein [Thermodesulfobacteria bacterium]|nr:flippase-like domain-containing protein [Thermodesulfobacteriota bacterium]